MHLFDTNFPPLTEPEKDFCHYPRRCWYTSSPKLPPQGNDNEFRVLLIRPGSRGDVLFLEPVVRSIKHKFPNSKIDIATIHSELFKHNPNVNGIMQLQNKKFQNLYGCAPYQYLYWMSYEFTPKLHPIDAYCSIVGVDPIDFTPKLHIHKNEYEEANKTLKMCKIEGPFIAIHTECEWKTRSWSEQHWLRLVDKLREEYSDHMIIDFSLNGGYHMTNVFGLKGFPLRIVAAILSKASLLVCIDSGIMHLGVAMDIPVFSLFSITDPNKRLPVKYLDTAIQCASKWAGYQHKRPAPVEDEPVMDDLIIDTIQPSYVFSKIVNTMSKI